MPKRPIQHLIAEKAVSRISCSMPEEWVVREKDKDYGIDLEVEIFIDGETTGDLFYIQSKGTKSTKKPPSLSIDIEHLNYWRSLAYPVFIFLYSDTEDKLYYVWVSEIELSNLSENQKSITIKFDENYEFECASCERIRKISRAFRGIREISNFQQIPILIDGRSANVFSSAERVRLYKFIEKSPVVRRHSEPDDFSLIITVSEEIITVSLYETFKSSIEITESDNDFVVDTVIAAIIICLSRAGLERQSESIAKLFFDQNMRAINKRVAAHVATALLGDLDVAINFALQQGLHDFSDESIIFHINLHFWTRRFDSDLGALERFYRKSLEEFQMSGPGAPVAEAFFNLGNTLQNQNKSRESIKHYIKAAKNNRDYLHRAYFLQLLGSELYKIGKVRWSAIAYQKSVDIEPSGERHLYLADALLRSGDIERAYNQYFVASEELDDHRHWWARNMQIVSRGLLREHGGVIIRDKAGAKAYWNRVSNLDIETPLESSVHILKNIDPLDSTSCFNVGVQESRNGNHDSALFAFLCCLIEEPFNTECWANAFISSFNIGPEANVVAASILILANNRVGEEFREHFVNEQQQGRLPRSIIDFIDDFQAAQFESSGYERTKTAASGLRIWGN